MKNRQHQLMSNSTFLSALYLDPRFQVVLSIEEEALAVQHLNTVWVKLLDLQSQSNNDFHQEGNQSLLEPSTSSVESSITQTIDDEREIMLAETERDRRQQQRARYIQTRADISNILQKISYHPRLSSKENILSFWDKKAMVEPQLSRLARVVFAVPATQVSVERLFSSLKYILSN